MSADTGRGSGSDVLWLSSEQQQDWAALMQLVMTLPAALDAQLKRDAGVNSFEYHVLARLSMARDRTLVLSELAEQAQGSLSRLSHAVTRLERAGWVVRRTCTDGGRRVEARLTDEGFAKLEAIAPGHVREVRRLVVDVLTPAQLAALGEAARAVAAAVLEGAPEACGEAGDC
ncbi:MarR family transcriptional regulator [Blastococcus sp. TML/C7B]|uniref:MarR family winged helix-turn-helix transcriptional regulator n=1 Tax=Blastococcus sp. TML/C7B TaxID=2798728 RepID=UPI002814E9BB|nr:MarR family transcriptional regulator [Blastococcus sp. TML/C7B]